MAYSDWGAFVYKNGVHRNDREDVAVFNDEEKDTEQGLRIFANIAKRLVGGDSGWHNMSHHAVLGDGVVRLCCYKNRVELWRKNKKGNAVQIKMPELYVSKENVWASVDRLDLHGEIHVVNKRWEFRAKKVNTKLVDLELIEPDGSKWRAKCGSLYGAGHMDAPEGGI